ncbi:efflux RND transporter periplasmic adaptor subunit [Gluconobacter sp. P1C6_b]|uniref:efflux RND transporter periplasmic adaptor subunit n=1 Tax=Gluconobacter sp. P1C6_b TaxID=2762619 RepID=UPI00207B69E0|nr:HlyD family efflux transporter periplasmic adaptor subunit [Gluconobacter sp. P1C6_b]
MDRPVPHSLSNTDRPPSAPGTGMDRAVRPSKRRTLARRALRYGVPIAIVASLVAGWRLVPAAGTLSVPHDQFSLATVSSAPFLDYLPVRATVAPLNVTYIDAVQGGEVAEVVARDGALVKKGEILARLTNPQLQLDVTSREAQIASQLGAVSAQRLTLQQTRTTEETQLAEARYNLLKAQRELSIREQLHGQGFESDANVQSYRDEANYYDQRLKRLEGALTQDLKIADRQGSEIDEEAQRLRSNLDVVESSLDALVLRASLPGRLTNFDLQSGQSLKAGDKIGQIDSEGLYRLDADIDEFYLGRVAVGERAEADLGNTKIPMTVSRVHPQVTSGQFRAELTFDRPPPGDLRRGESVDLRITLGETHRALVLPNGAWLEASGGSSAFVMASNGRTADRVSITSGRRNPDQVEITGGLHEGDQVIVSSYNSYKNFNHLAVH